MVFVRPPLNLRLSLSLDPFPFERSYPFIPQGTEIRIPALFATDKLMVIELLIHFRRVWNQWRTRNFGISYLETIRS